MTSQTSDVFSYDVVFTALCVMEHIENISSQKINQVVEQYRQDYGSAALRDTIIRNIAPKIESAYLNALSTINLSGDFCCYDFEFVPEVFELATDERQSLDIGQEFWTFTAIKWVWLNLFAESLKRTYGIEISDIGESDLFAQYSDGGIRPPIEAVKEIGNKRDLDPINQGFM